MGFIIFWSILLLIWLVSFIVDLVSDDETKGGKHVFNFFMLFLSALMLAYYIDRYQTKKIFKSLRVGNVYIGTPKDNPFKMDTVKVTNLVKKNEKYWVQYETPNGESHVFELDDIIEYFK